MAPGPSPSSTRNDSRRPLGAQRRSDAQPGIGSVEPPSTLSPTEGTCSSSVTSGNPQSVRPGERSISPSVCNRWWSLFLKPCRRQTAERLKQPFAERATRSTSALASCKTSCRDAKPFAALSSRPANTSSALFWRSPCSSRCPSSSLRRNSEPATLSASMALPMLSLSSSRDAWRALLCSSTDASVALTLASSSCNAALLRSSDSASNAWARDAPRSSEAPSSLRSSSRPDAAAWLSEEARRSMSAWRLSTSASAASVATSLPSACWTDCFTASSWPRRSWTWAEKVFEVSSLAPLKIDSSRLPSVLMDSFNSSRTSGSSFSTLDARTSCLFICWASWLSSHSCFCLVSSSKAFFFPMAAGSRARPRVRAPRPARALLLP
mmetsp:Transcript_45556/g.127006  ORF Transcript_45556/g.127006 Transcript_45556/m.127006 type:complete len:380 (+) Transcript_45556:1145-2284(+)